MIKALSCLMILLILAAPVFATPELVVASQPTTKSAISIPLESIKAVGETYVVQVPNVTISSGAISSSQTTAVALPTNMTVKISPSDANPVSVEGKPVEFQGIEAIPAISMEVASTTAGGQVPLVSTTTVSVLVDEQKKQTIIESANVSAVTEETLKFQNHTILVETPKGDVNVQLLPVIATQVAVSTEPQKVESVELKVVDDKPVYETVGTKEARILWIAPVTVPVTTQINAQTGDVVKVEKPWWSFLAW